MSENNTPQTFKGIIFDMDGTMIDNMMIHHHAWQRKLAGLGMEMSLAEVMEKAHGINEEIIERLFGDRFTPEDRKRISAEKETEYREIYLPDLSLIDGLQEFLDTLKAADFPMAIGTAAPPGNASFVVDNLKLTPYFKGIFNSSHVSNGKPNPEIFQKAAASMGLAPEDCVVFEDSPTGVETALNAGSKAVAVTTTHSEEEFEKYPNVLFYIEDYRDSRLLELISTF